MALSVVVAQRTAAGHSPVKALLITLHGAPRSISAALGSPRFEVTRAGCAADAKRRLGAAPVDIVLLDLAGQGDDGLLLCADVRARTHAALIVLAEADDATARVLAFKLGADDVVSRAIDQDELLARIGALLRRTGFRSAGSHGQSALAGPAPRQQLGALTIDRLRGRAAVGDALLPLTPAQYRLLSSFMTNPGTVLTRADLARAAGNEPHLIGSRSVDVQVRRLRDKLRRGQQHLSEGQDLPEIESVRGRGYRLTVPRRTAATGPNSATSPAA